MTQYNSIVNITSSPSVRMIPFHRMTPVASPHGGIPRNMMNASKLICEFDLLLSPLLLLLLMMLFLFC